MRKGISYALVAAVLFGASTPFAKIMVGQVAPVALAGLLYFGSGLGLLAWFLARSILKRNVHEKQATLTRGDMPWLGGAILAGGVAGPVLLMVGLTLTPASSASLLLNMEGVLTSLLAWFVFKENFDRRLLSGMALIVVAGVLLSWGERPALGAPWGPIAIVGACLCWGIDNNLTRKVSAGDAVQIACAKGLIAGCLNLVLAALLGQKMPPLTIMLTAGAVGFAGYGLSLVLFVLALRHLGTARTGAYFSAAPLAGAAVALVVLGETPGPMFWLAALLMVAGLWLHMTEIHDHRHEHPPLTHAHEHTHDAHHQHAHDFDWDGNEPHAHAHKHAPTVHAHSHYPDIHHRHDH
jgi:drug/metabolite transporter (DMT)-like permease